MSVDFYQFLNLPNLESKAQAVSIRINESRSKTGVSERTYIIGQLGKHNLDGIMATVHREAGKLRINLPEMYHRQHQKQPQKVTFAVEAPEGRGSSPAAARAPATSRAQHQSTQIVQVGEEDIEVGELTEEDNKLIQNALRTISEIVSEQKDKKQKDREDRFEGTSTAQHTAHEAHGRPGQSRAATAGDRAKNTGSKQRTAFDQELKRQEESNREFRREKRDERSIERSVREKRQDIEKDRLKRENLESQ